jgi:hypothetical protein
MASAALAAPVVGSVKSVQGGVAVVRGAAELAAQPGLHLEAQDVLRTAADSHVGLILLDGTRVSLGPKSELKISEFAYAPAESRLGLVLHLARGVLAYVSGRIAALAPESVRVETPVGSIGLRGTKFAVTLEGE